MTGGSTQLIFCQSSRGQCTHQKLNINSAKMPRNNNYARSSRFLSLIIKTSICLFSLRCSPPEFWIFELLWYLQAQNLPATTDAMFELECRAALKTCLTGVEAYYGFTRSSHSPRHCAKVLHDSYHIAESTFGRGSLFSCKIASLYALRLVASLCQTTSSPRGISCARHRTIFRQIDF